VAAPGEGPFGEFAARFAEAWSAPTPTRLSALLTDDVVLIQPLGPTTRGKAEAEHAFAGILELIPDLHAEVHRSWGDEAGGSIEFDLVGTLGGSELRWHLVDVFDLRDGLGSKRVSYFDPAPIIRAVATRPRAWLPFVRSRLPGR
jgi:ketosteroid isomerase-like protein